MDVQTKANIADTILGTFSILGISAIDFLKDFQIVEHSLLLSIQILIGIFTIFKLSKNDKPVKKTTNKRRAK
jgi:hypothetical protein